MSAVLAPAVHRRRLRVRGQVQGVGFRPTVYRLATELGLGGRVLNDGAGVEIELEGTDEALDRLRRSACAARRRGCRASTRSTPRRWRRWATARSRSSRARAGRSRPASRRTPAPVPTASPTCSIRRTGAGGTRSRTARTADRATRSRARCPTTARTPAWRRSSSARRARRNTTRRPTVASTRSRTRARRADRGWRCGTARAAARGRRTRSRRPCSGSARGGIVAIKGLGGFHLVCDARNAARRRRTAPPQAARGEAVRRDVREPRVDRAAGARHDAGRARCWPRPSGRSCCSTSSPAATRRSPAWRPAWRRSA